MQQTLGDPRNQANIYAQNLTPNAGQRIPSWTEQIGIDPTSKLAEAVRDHAAAIRELADVLYHIGTED
jgi:hypothetical protein